MPTRSLTLLSMSAVLLAGVCFVTGCTQNVGDTPTADSSPTSQPGNSTPVAANTESVTLSVPGMT